MTRSFPLFVKNKTREDKLANIIVSLSQLDEMLSLWLTNHFLKIDDTEQNEDNRDAFEKLILSKLSFREKSEIVSMLLGDKSGVKKLKSKLIKVCEIRNLVAHKTGLIGIPGDIDELYEEFDILMKDLGSFIELVYYEYSSDMSSAYIKQHEN
jgi:uncharacterized protein YutE (UPF0331/DUF86 family)